MTLLKALPSEVLNAGSANQETQLSTCYEKFAQGRFDFINSKAMSLKPS